MKLTGEGIQFAIDTMAAEVAQRYASDKQMAHTEALKNIMKTKTYKLLSDPEAFLYLESVEYVLDMLDAEAKGDMNRWLEV